MHIHDQSESTLRSIGAFKSDGTREFIDTKVIIKVQFVLEFERQKGKPTCTQEIKDVTCLRCGSACLRLLKNWNRLWLSCNWQP